MPKIVLVAHLTYENQWDKLRTKIQTFAFFGTPYYEGFITLDRFNLVIKLVLRGVSV